MAEEILGKAYQNTVSARHYLYIKYMYINLKIYNYPKYINSGIKYINKLINRILNADLMANVKKEQ